MSEHCVNGSVQACTFVTNDSATVLSLLLFRVTAPEPSLLRNLAPLVASEPSVRDSRRLMLFEPRWKTSSGAVDCPAIIVSMLAMVPTLSAAVPSTADTSLSVSCRCEPVTEYPCMHN